VIGRSAGFKVIYRDGTFAAGQEMDLLLVRFTEKPCGTGAMPVVHDSPFTLDIGAPTA
jgi:hypothetical protein